MEDNILKRERERIYTEGAKKCIHILRDVIYILLFEVELNYSSNV